MTKLLARIFIKDYENTESPAVRSAYGKMSGWVGIVCNILLCAGKFFAGILSGSVSITADAVNNLSDASSSIISLLGFKLSEKSADEEHPYGHARYEYLAGLLVALFILLIGAELLKSSAVKIFNPEPVEFTIVSVVVLAASIIVKFLMMAFYKSTARLIDSETLNAAAADSRNDVITTAAVLTSVIVSNFTPLELDGIMGALVALFIIYSGIGLVRDAISPLLGKAPDEKLVEDIRGAILSHKGVLGAHDLMIHDYGPAQKFASVHVEVAAETSLLDGHEIADSIENEFREKGLNMTVHIDPRATDGEAGEAHRCLEEIVRGIDERLSVHDVRLIPCGDHTRCVFDCVVPSGVGLSEGELKEEITRFLQQEHPDYRCSITFDSSFAPIQRRDSGED